MIVQTNGDDPEFAARAAEWGAFGFSTPVEPDALQTAIEVAMRRFEELEELTEQVDNLEGALRRRALVERAKGILMERRDLDERAAFELLRERARSSNRTLVDVAQSLLDTQKSKSPGRKARALRKSLPSRSLCPAYGTNTPWRRNVAVVAVGAGDRRSGRRPSPRPGRAARPPACSRPRCPARSRRRSCSTLQVEPIVALMVDTQSTVNWNGMG